MSNAVTETEEIQYVSIITLAEDRLASNFRILSNRIKNQDDLLEEHAKSIEEIKSKGIQDIRKMMENERKDILDLKIKIEECFQALQICKNKQTEADEKIEQNKNRISSNCSEIVDLKLMIEENYHTNENKSNEMKEEMEAMKICIERAFEQILKKEDSKEVLKMHDKIDRVSEKTNKNEKDVSQIEHKMEKMEILSQKTERNQARKDVDLMREIDEKIKKQVKGLQKNLFSSPMAPILEETPSEDYLRVNVPPIERDPAKKQSHVSQKSLADEEFSNKSQKLAVSKINDKLIGLQNKLKNLQMTMGKVCSKKSSKENEYVTELKMLQKINEIKPEMIKLWAKCDTLDDKIAFGDRRLEEKTKIIQSLMENQRENNWGKMEDKIKIFQTEVYTNFKDIRLKIDNKVNVPDYQKHCHSLDDKIRQINELIFIKSDKIEVKKALLFLEAKIKEIILVISQEEETEKDALLTKKQLKCMSCDKEVDKMMTKGVISGSRGNWDAMPLKEHSPEILGKFGMTNFGSLGKKLKKLNSGDLPILNTKRNRNENKENSIQQKLGKEV